jgi:hypothetical protein
MHTDVPRLFHVRWMEMTSQQIQTVWRGGAALCADTNGRHLVIDLGRVRTVAAVATYSWHE